MIFTDSFQKITVFCFLGIEGTYPLMNLKCGVWYKYQSFRKILFSMPKIHSFCKLSKSLFSKNMGHDPTEFSGTNISSISRTNSGDPLDVHFHTGPF